MGNSRAVLGLQGTKLPGSCRGGLHLRLHLVSSAYDRTRSQTLHLRGLSYEQENLKPGGSPSAARPDKWPQAAGKGG